MDSMLFQIQLLDDKGMETIFDSFFFFILEKYTFSSIVYAVLFSYFAFVILPLKTFCAVLFCAIVYAAFVVIFAFTFHREIILNSIKIPEPHQDKRGDLQTHNSHFWYFSSLVKLREQIGICASGGLSEGILR